MTKLHQILAIEKGVAAETDRRVALATRGMEVGGEQSPLDGLSRTYQPRKEDGDTFPAQTMKVQIRAEVILTQIAQAMTRLMDVKFTREEANTKARAHVVIDGVPVLTDVPAGYLLYLESMLNELRGLVLRVPVLDPAEQWEPDDAQGVHRSAEKRTVREVRVPAAQVITPNQVIDGQKFDAQIRVYETTEPAGDWTVVKYSGALPAPRREEILDRIATLLTAVKLAREEANGLDVENRKAGEAVFSYLLHGTLPQ